MKTSVPSRTIIKESVDEIKQVVGRLSKLVGGLEWDAVWGKEAPNSVFEEWTGNGFQVIHQGRSLRS